MHMSSDLITTNLLFAKQSASLQPYAKGRNQRANDSFGKGFNLLKDHVQTVNDWALPE